MTELEAVNTMLAIIGEAPIDKLADITANEISDASLARKTLHEVDRDVQAEGWLWNTNYEVSLSVDSKKEYVLPKNTLRADFSPNRYPYSNLVVRGLKVWDRSLQTYALGDANDSQPIVVDQIVEQLDWDELPQMAQQYISIRAGRIYSDRNINSNVIFSYTVQDESYARAQLIRSEEASLSSNLLWGNDRHMGQGYSYFPSQGTRFRTN